MNDDHSRTFTFEELYRALPQKGLSQQLLSKMIDQFDWDAKYGPNSGITREQRYQRAIYYGLNPPPEIKDYLNTKPHPYA